MTPWLNRMRAGEGVRWLTAAVGILAALNAASATAGEHHLSKIPPTMEIEVLDPQADPLGRPAVELTSDGDSDLQVDIPRPVLVHKLYYTGDRKFQAQLLPGGPVIVVATHPHSGERCYIDVQLPPGAPVVYYKGHCIEYDYGNQGVIITFTRLCRPKVTYRNGVCLPRKARQAAKTTVVHTAKAFGRTGVPAHVAIVAKGTGNLVCNTACAAGNIGQQLLAPVVAIARATPLGSLAKRDPARDAENVRALDARKAEHLEAPLDETIPTVR